MKARSHDAHRKQEPGTTVAAFLARLPPERRREVERVRDLVRRHLPAGYEEVVAKNMLVYQVPLARYSDTYNGHPLWYIALAAEKSYLSLHLMPIYGDLKRAERLKAGFRAAGKKLDMGKACVRFRTTDDLAMDAIAEVVSSVTVNQWVEIAAAARRRQ